MTWRNFQAVALPPEIAAVDAKNGTAVRLAVRWVAMRVAFVFFHLRLTANQVSLLGWVLGIAALYFIAMARHFPHWNAWIVIFCSSASTFMDFCDGPVARARRSASRLGSVFDGISTDFMRAGLLAALGVVAGSPIFIVTGLATGYIVVSIRNQFIWNGLLSPSQGWKSLLFSLLRISFSVPAMTGVLPIGFVVAILLDMTPIFAKGVLALYAVLSVWWFWLACAGARSAVRESSGADSGDHAGHPARELVSH